jgi:hypothetical protein
MSPILTKRALICLASTQILLACTVLSAIADSDSNSKPKLLKGNASKQGEKENPGLQRSDLTNPNASADPFSGDEKPDEIDAPTKDMMKMDPVRQPAMAPPLSGNVNDQGAGNMQSMLPKGNPFGGDEEPMPNFPQQPQRQSQVQQNDPDSSPDMQLLWDMWHKRVAEAIYQRFNFLAKLGFKHSPPLLCQVSYVVTRDGHINNVQIQQKSPNILFNMIVSQTVKSLDGDVNLLTFPQGSRRSFVPKVGTFTQNYGNDGFKYTTGDKETINQQRR